MMSLIIILIVSPWMVNCFIAFLWTFYDESRNDYLKSIQIHDSAIGRIVGLVIQFIPVIGFSYYLYIIFKHFNILDQMKWKINSIINSIIGEKE